jgi:hypothetical protein
VADEPVLDVIIAFCAKVKGAEVVDWVGNALPVIHFVALFVSADICVSELDWFFATKAVFFESARLFLHILVVVCVKRPTRRGGKLSVEPT